MQNSSYKKININLSQEDAIEGYGRFILITNKRISYSAVGIVPAIRISNYKRILWFIRFLGILSGLPAKCTWLFRNYYHLICIDQNKHPNTEAVVTWKRGEGWGPRDRPRIRMFGHLNDQPVRVVKMRGARLCLSHKYFWRMKMAELSKSKGRGQGRHYRKGYQWSTRVGEREKSSRGEDGYWLTGI